MLRVDISVISLMHIQVNLAKFEKRLPVQKTCILAEYDRDLYDEHRGVNHRGSTKCTQLLCLHMWSLSICEINVLELKLRFLSDRRWISDDPESLTQGKKKKKSLLHIQICASLWESNTQCEMQAFDFFFTCSWCFISEAVWEIQQAFILAFCLCAESIKVSFHIRSLI